MRNIVYDLVDYISTSYKINYLTEAKKEADDNLLDSIMTHCTSKKITRRQDKLRKKAIDLCDELRDAEQYKIFLEYCIHHPIKTSDDNKIAINEYHTALEEENTAWRKYIYDVVEPVEDYEDEWY